MGCSKTFPFNQFKLSTYTYIYIDVIRCIYIYIYTHGIDMRMFITRCWDSRMTCLFPFCCGRAFKLKMASWLVFFANPEKHAPHTLGIIVPFLARKLQYINIYKQTKTVLAPHKIHIQDHTSPKFSKLCDRTNLQSGWILRFLPLPQWGILIRISGGHQPQVPPTPVLLRTL